MFQLPAQPSILHSQVARDLDAVSKLFNDWEQESQVRLSQSRAATTFPDMEAALCVFNRRGERRHPTTNATIQEFFFVARHASPLNSDTACTSCYSALFQPTKSSVVRTSTTGRQSTTTAPTNPPPPPSSSSSSSFKTTRQVVYYIDKSKPSCYTDCLCEHCLVSIMREVLGNNDDEILQEAQCIAASLWVPRLVGNRHMR